MLKLLDYRGIDGIFSSNTENAPEPLASSSGQDEQTYVTTADSDRAHP